MFMILLLPALLIGDGDPQGERNLAKHSELPQGAGLATEFPRDTGIDKHPQVRFAEDFERESFHDDWDDVRDRDGAVLSRTQHKDSSVQQLLGGKALCVTATLGKNTGGGLTKWFESGERVHVRFYVKFAEDVDYIHHFVTLRANRGLTGGDRWSGFGGAGERPQGDQRFSTALEPWGDWGNNSPPGRWNFYSYWHEMSASRDGKFWGNAFRPAKQPLIPKGEWICAEFMLKHNTPGEADGEQAWWIDGQLIGHWQGINWRTDEQLQANALTLESYVTDRWTEQKQNIVYFDNLVIATDYIGPAVPTPNDSSQTPE